MKRDTQIFFPVVITLADEFELVSATTRSKVKLNVRMVIKVRTMASGKVCVITRKRPGSLTPARTNAVETFHDIVVAANARNALMNAKLSLFFFKYFWPRHKWYTVLPMINAFKLSVRKSR